MSNYVLELDDDENNKKGEEEEYNILPKVLPTNI
jgi:hypothetical protein